MKLKRRRGATFNFRRTFAGFARSNTTYLGPSLVLAPSYDQVHRCTKIRSRKRSDANDRRARGAQSENEKTFARFQGRNKSHTSEGVSEVIVKRSRVHTDSRERKWKKPETEKDENLSSWEEYGENQLAHFIGRLRQVQQTMPRSTRGCP